MMKQIQVGLGIGSMAPISGRFTGLQSLVRSDASFTGWMRDCRRNRLCEHQPANISLDLEIPAEGPASASVQQMVTQ